MKLNTPIRDFRDDQSHDILLPDGTHLATMSDREDKDEQDGLAGHLVTCWNACLGTEMPPDIAPGTIATLVAAARMGLDYLKRTNPLEHGNPDLGRTWGALEDALAPFSKDTLPPPPSVIHVAPFNG